MDFSIRGHPDLLRSGLAPEEKLHKLANLCQGALSNYLAFGNTDSQTNPGDLDRFGFAGREEDFVTGLYNNRARWFSPAMIRLISQDTLGLRAGDANLYRYVRNGPTMYTDPSGHLLIDAAVQEQVNLVPIAKGAIAVGLIAVAIYATLMFCSCEVIDPVTNDVKYSENFFTDIMGCFSRELFLKSQYPTFLVHCSFDGH